MLVSFDLVGHEAREALPTLRQFIDHITLKLLIIVKTRLDKLEDV